MGKTLLILFLNPEGLPACSCGMKKVALEKTGTPESPLMGK